VLTGANDEQMIRFGLDRCPYEVFTLRHDPEKSDPAYYRATLAHYGLAASDVMYFEHAPAAVESARSVGIETWFYDESARDLNGLKEFLDERCEFAA
jgi:HAD superfamily hydrolase (TIGR01509 family)